MRRSDPGVSVRDPGVAANHLRLQVAVVGPDRESDRARGFEAQGIHFPGPKGGACPPEHLHPGLLVVTAAFPGLTQPYRGVFIEHLSQALARWTRVRILAPALDAGDPLVESRGRLRLRRFRYGAAGRGLKYPGGGGLLRLGRYALAFRRALAQELERDRPAAILAHWLLPTAALALPLAARAHLPLVAMAHGSDVHTLGPRWPWRRLLAGVQGRARGLIYASEDLRARGRAIGPDRPDARVLHCGAQQEFYRPRDRLACRRALGLPESGPGLIYVGDLTVAKGCWTAALAALRLADAEGLWFRMLGSGDQAGALAQLFAARGRGQNLVLNGAVRPADMPTWMAAADVLLFPSRAEGLPVTVLEARAAGLPVAAARVGGVAEALGTAPGILLDDPAGVSGFVAAARELLARPRPPVDTTLPSTDDQAARLIEWLAGWSGP